jgi:hypothetical protein
VVAALNREMAQAHDEVAGDATQQPETRRAAQEIAMALRERAKSLELDAQRLTRYPAYAPSMAKPTSCSTEPERRRQARRTRARRSHRGTVGAPRGRNRRITPERRQRDRRGGAVIAR